MGEYEPDDSRNVTQTPHRAPGEPPPTGPREDTTRRQDDKPDTRRRAQTEQDAQDIGWRTEQDGRTGIAHEDYVRSSPQATTQAERVSPRPTGATGQPGDLAREFREERGGESGFGSAMEGERNSNGYRAGMAAPDFDESRAGEGQAAQGMVNSTDYDASQQQAQQETPRPGAEATVGTADRAGLSGNDAVRRAQAHMGEQPGYGGGTPPRQMTESTDARNRDKGLGYGASDGDEMGEAPDASQRGYGGRGELKEEGER